MNRHFFFTFLSLTSYLNLIQASVTSTPDNRNSTYGSSAKFKRQQQSTEFVSTCGFEDGDADQPRTANSGYDCRVDTQHAIWGFCPTTVVSASDCGLAGNCVDSHSCSNGCGVTGTPGITTFTCTASGADFCSTALLTAGPDQTYSYLACAKSAETVHLLAEASTTSSTTRAVSSSTSSPTIAPSTSSTTLSATSLSSTASSSSSSSSSTSSVLQALSTSSPAITLASAPSLQPNNPTASPNAFNPGSNNVGAIVGGVIGGLALICFVILATVFLLRHRGKNRGTKPENPAVAFDANQIPWRDDRVTRNAETSNYPYWNHSSPVELSTQKANSPFELSS